MESPDLDPQLLEGLCKVAGSRFSHDIQGKIRGKTVEAFNLADVKELVKKKLKIPSEYYDLVHAE